VIVSAPPFHPNSNHWLPENPDKVSSLVGSAIGVGLDADWPPQAIVLFELSVQAVVVMVACAGEGAIDAPSSPKMAMVAMAVRLGIDALLQVKRICVDTLSGEGERSLKVPAWFVPTSNFLKTRDLRSLRKCRV
jgi:hypothetical protein